MSLKDVRFMLRLDRNLISISALTKDGWKLIFEKEGAVVLKEGQLMTIREAGGVYSVIIVSLTSTDSSTAFTSSASSTSLTPSGPAGRWL
jgi:hypothetical protein